MNPDRVEYTPNGVIDDFYIEGASVHLERLNNGYYLSVQNKERRYLIDLRSASGRAVVHATVREAEAR